MIEVNLYSVPTGSGVNATMGHLIDRTRFNSVAMGTSIMSVVKGFLKTNVQSFETVLNNDSIISFINDDITMTTTDFACINYWLAKAGFLVQIFNVADDEDNPTAISAERSEWNIIDTNFVQFDYPTSVKFLPAEGMNVIDVLKKVSESGSLFDSSKLGDTKNPIKEAVDMLIKIKDATGNIEAGLSTKIYNMLDEVGIKLFLAVGQ